MVTYGSHVNGNNPQLANTSPRARVLRSELRVRACTGGGPRKMETKK